MKIYMAVTPDEMEIPIATAITPRELAKKVGLTSRQVRDLLAGYRSGKVTNAGIRIGIRIVCVEDDGYE